MNVLTDQIVRESLKHVGANGRMEKVRKWLKRVGYSPCAPWSVAFAWCMLDDACSALGLVNRIAPCAGVKTLMALAKERRVLITDGFGPGYIFGIDNWREPERLPHCGIIIEASTDGECRTVEGPINLVSGMEGNCVAIKTRMAYEFTLGCLDPGLLFV